jgi:hypothetical protein
MSNSKPVNKKARRHSRKITQSAPARHVETWCSVSGESLECELFATEDDSVVCGIMHESTSSVQVPDLPGSWLLPDGMANSAKLVCCHVFHPVALVLHFLVSDMRCPVCRAGHPERMDFTSVPEGLRTAYAGKSQQMLIAALLPDTDNLRENIVEVLAHMEVTFSVLGDHNGLPDRATVRTRVVFETTNVHEIEQRMHLSASLANSDTVHELSSDFTSELSVHRSFQRLVRGLVACHASNPHARVRFALVHPFVPVTIASEDMPVAEAWDKFFAADAADNHAADKHAADNHAADNHAGDNHAADALQSVAHTILLYCAAVAGTSPVGVLVAEFLDNLPTPRLSLKVNTLMLVNIAGYVREVLQSIREALEHHTSFDSAPLLEFTTHAINGVVFE